MDRAAFQALQEEQPWTDIWSADFLADPRSYSRFEHCIINIVAFAGDILRRIERADHYGADYTQAIDKDRDGEALSYIVMSAMKAANVHPDGAIDLSALIESDLKRRSK